MSRCTADQSDLCPRTGDSPTDLAGGRIFLTPTWVEKAAQDAGFDLTPAREGHWMIFRSSAFPQVLGAVAACRRGATLAGDDRSETPDHPAFRAGYLQPVADRLLAGALHRQVTVLAFASDKHRDQRRKDAEASPYINHPIALANLLANEAGMDDQRVLLASVLHDTIGDIRRLPSWNLFATSAWMSQTLQPARHRRVAASGLVGSAQAGILRLSQGSSR